ncbi:iron complex transport system permease protein [Micromonospora pattaloongensis]|uniref:Iron complex transport system permease protein n=1 Tax=Micromonospora pattaloongensis TaxID=405436 RepID=A0A1H3P0X2_9ACTN|nr:iron chelate uptake ABC transporter family permease subunit [Micromonospora pattaloongensis]SDY94766.1 iron complex transport system permease protein [Micromonospora pattaloongensis]
MTAVPAGRSLLRLGPVTLLVRRRAQAVAVLLLILLAAAMLLSLSLGTPYVAPVDVLRALPGDGTPYDLVVRDLRLPRVVLAAVAGAAFGVAGTLVQAVSRNPLASPDVIGVTQGAGLAATVALTTGAAAALVAPAALAGGLLAAAAVLALGARHGLAAQRFVLAGVAVAVALRALIEVVMLAADPIDGLRAQVWLIGTLAGRGWQETAYIAGTLAVLLPVLLWAGWSLSNTALDDDTARGIGLRPTARRVGLATTGVLAAAMVTAQVGAVDFVALVAPQVARRLVRAERPPLLCAALVGALLLVLADLAGRRLFAPTQLPAGVLTAAIGGPYLLFLLVRGRRRPS